MKKSPLFSPLSWALAFVAASALLGAEDSAPPVQMSPYEVTAPPFTSPFQEFYSKLDSRFDGPWVDTGRSGALIEAIIWRHGYLSTHPSDQAVILIDRKGERVEGATTVYTAGDRIYANSWALGEHVRLRGLAAADLQNAAKLRRALRRIRGAYRLEARFALNRSSFLPGDAARSAYGSSLAAFDSGGFVPRDNGSFGGGYYIPPVLGAFTAQPDLEQISAQQARQVRAAGIHAAGAVQTADLFQPFAGVGYSVFSVNGLPQYLGDAFHEAPGQILDTVYRALSNPRTAGRVPVGLGYVPVNAPLGDGTPGPTKMVPVLTFDWEGVHYLYRPEHGTAAYPIARNPVTDLPYLFVRDSGLMESIYFCATYGRSHPGERAVVIPGDTPAAAYTIRGRLGFFCPALNAFAASKRLAPAAIDQPKQLGAAVAEMTAAVAARPAKRGALTEGLVGDTPDAQMRRAFLAFDAAGLSPRLRSSPESSSLTFTWQGASYVYGQDQRVARLN
ncbi:MAG TPA: hypothetical protein VHC86_04880 [Opitutaceae bacterium]|nr:hypothetical protein [Opitutaceae bacterium]